MVKNLLLLIAFLLCPRAVLPQQYFFSNYSLEEGLSQSVVNCLYQDSRGFIWAGTQNGLNKFNGYAFEIYSYNPSDTNSLSNNWVYSVAEDRDGDLWICTKRGLNKFIRKENRFQRIHYATGYLHDVTNYPYDAIVSSSGKVLINTPPVLTVYDPGKKTFTHFTSALEYDGSVKDNRIPLLEDTEGLIWAGSTRGLACFDPKSKTFRYFKTDPVRKNAISDNSVTALFEDRKGCIWAGTNNGLNRYDKKTGQFTTFYNEPRNPFSLSHNFIRSVIQDNTGNFWIGTEGTGLNKLSFVKGDQPFFENFTSENNRLSHNIVNSLFIDRSENLWIGTLQGISKADLKKQKFNLYHRSDSPYSVNLLGNVIASIYKDENGILWIGNWGQGLNLFDRKTGHVEHFSTRMHGKNHLTNDFVHVVFGDSGHRIWIGTRDGVFIFDREKHRFLRMNEYFRNGRIPDLSGLRIFMIIQDRAGSYWIGTQNGLYRINTANGTTERFYEEAAEDHRVSSNLIYCLLEDRDGIIWIATLNGLDAYNPGSGKLSHFRKVEGSANSLCDNFVITLCEDHAGRIWIGTSTYVNCFTKKDSLFTYYSQENGLPNNRIFEILEDDRHTIWFATGNGLARFDTVSKTFRTYTVEQGLQGREFNLRASFRSPDGEMFFGGMNGFNSFYPDSIRDNPFIPPVVFTSFYTITGGIKKFLDIRNTEEVVLKYNENIFTIEFAALEYTNPGNNRYAYRLEGVSDAWIDLGTRRFVPFTNLPAGEYRFTVRGCNNDGKWNETGKSLRIVIRPPWWRSWPAYISYFLVFALLVFLYIKWRERNLIRQRTILEIKVEQRTFQIEHQKEELEHLNATKDKFFSIIAHDLRSPFNSILGFSDMLLSGFREYDQDKIEKYLTNIKDSSRQAFELLQNLLFWARSQTGTLEFKPVPFDLKERIEENIFMVKSQAEKKSISITHSAEEGQTASGDVNMIDTVLRNLLTNAIKFSAKGSSVTVQVRESGDKFEVTVKDSGVGIAEENLARIFRVDSKFTRQGTEKERGTGLGLILCKEFVERHGSTIHVESEPGKGSEFRFFLSKG
ncbi:MAG: ATP-binding protein [Bacteroidetes bacterium]|nr:ATP-binding protein [Bacteroidota bacterium]